MRRSISLVMRELNLSRALRIEQSLLNLDFELNLLLSLGLGCVC